MKKLIMAAMLAGTMISIAEETNDQPPPPPPAAVQNGSEPLTKEQRAEIRAQHKKIMAARMAEMEKRAIEIIKKYGLDDEKAKSLFGELKTAMRPVRRTRPTKKPQAKPVPKTDSSGM